MTDQEKVHALSRAADRALARYNYHMEWSETLYGRDAEAQERQALRFLDALTILEDKRYALQLEMER